jgi:hypothetical protein
MTVAHNQIGINYFNQSGQLGGCINDAHNVQKFLCGEYEPSSRGVWADLASRVPCIWHSPPRRTLYTFTLGRHNHLHRPPERYNYRPEDMVILTDDSRNPRQIPTRANILQAIGWLVQGAQPNDALFFH